MSYAEAARVAAILGIDQAEVSATLLTMADNQVDLITNRSFGTLTDEQAIFDIEDRNYFWHSGSNTYIFTLDCSPVDSITKVVLDGEELTTEQYWAELKSDSVKFNKEQIEGIPSGQRKVIIDYKYGYAEVPEVIKDYASYLAAHIQDSVASAPKDDNGAVLSEIEIGRYREKYASLDSYLKGKYGKILQQYHDMIIDKYKLWC